MWTSVGKNRVRVCQWSGQLIKEGDNVFKIPEINLQGVVEWRGCYATPNCALAAIKNFSDSKSLAIERHAELVSLFQNSLHRLGGPDHVEVKSAPPPTNMKVFGGNMTQEEYRASYDPSGEMGKWFEQILPQKSAADTDDEHAPKSTWKHTLVTSKTKCNDAELLTMPQYPFTNPRNMEAVINFLSGLRVLVYPDEPINAPFAVYTNLKKGLVLVGATTAATWAEDPQQACNVAAHKLLGSGNMPMVYGDVIALHKKPLRFGKLKRTKKAVDPTQAAEAPAPAKPETPKRAKTQDEPGAPAKKRRKTTAATPAPTPVATPKK